MSIDLSKLGVAEQDMPGRKGKKFGANSRTTENLDRIVEALNRKGHKPVVLVIATESGESEWAGTKSAVNSLRLTTEDKKGERVISRTTARNYCKAMNQSDEYPNVEYVTTDHGVVVQFA